MFEKNKTNNNKIDLKQKTITLNKSSNNENEGYEC